MCSWVCILIRKKEGIVYTRDEEGFEDFMEQMECLCGARKLRCRQDLEKDAAVMPAAYYQTEDAVYIVIDNI